MPRKHRSEFWNAYKSATNVQIAAGKPKRASDLLGVVLAISARTRRIVAPPASIELDVFTPNGARGCSDYYGR